tara:strand:+ start:93 stop:731 length:639 start_codon:yes stop_codon:yes gene_type:complete
MNNKLTFIIGIVGVGLFAFCAILGGFFIDDYSVISQYISESYAIDTEYGLILRGFGYFPSGILISIFCFRLSKMFPPSKLTKIGFYALGIFYGIATIVVAIFPCDSGCNPEFIDPSISQVLHNLTGALTYLFVPLSILLVGIGLKQDPKYSKLSIRGIVYGILSMLFVFILFSDATSQFKGLYQRIIETLFIFWIVSCAITVKNKTHLIRPL